MTDCYAGNECGMCTMCSTDPRDAEIDRLRAELQRKDDTIDRVLAVCYDHEFGSVETRKIEEAIHGCGPCRGCDRLRAELADLKYFHDCAVEAVVSRDARLAAVIALCDETHGADARLYVAHVRAAATGDTNDRDGGCC